MKHSYCLIISILSTQLAFGYGTDKSQYSTSDLNKHDLTEDQWEQFAGGENDFRKYEKSLFQKNSLDPKYSCVLSGNSANIQVKKLVKCAGYKGVYWQIKTENLATNITIKSDSAKGLLIEFLKAHSIEGRVSIYKNKMVVFKGYK